MDTLEQEIRELKQRIQELKLKALKAELSSLEEDLEPKIDIDALNRDVGKWIRRHKHGHW